MENNSVSARVLDIAVPGRDRKVLLLASSDPGTGVLQEILANYAEVGCASGIPEMRNLLAEDHYDALFCDWRFAMGTWTDALEEVQRLHPDLPVIVVCRTGGARQWREVLDAGAFDLLTEPCSELAVMIVLEHALATRDARAIRAVA